MTSSAASVQNLLTSTRIPVLRIWRRKQLCTENHRTPRCLRWRRRTRYRQRRRASRSLSPRSHRYSFRCRLSGLHDRFRTGVSVSGWARSADRNASTKDSTNQRSRGFRGYRRIANWCLSERQPRRMAIDRSDCCETVRCREFFTFVDYSWLKSAIRSGGIA